MDTRGGIRFESGQGSDRLEALLGPGHLELRRDGATLAELAVGREGGAPVLLDARGLGADAAGLPAVSAAVEALIATSDEVDRLTLRVEPDSALRQACLAAGIAVPTGGDDLLVRPEMFWQRREPWLPDAAQGAYPEVQVMTGDRRHPLRRPKPSGVVYERFIPWLDRAITFRALDIDRDLALFHRWMNDPRVETIWSEGGDLAAHRAYLGKLQADPHMLPLVGAFGGEPFGYFEIYWGKENRLGPHYEADDYDRGWHVAVGEDAFRGRRYVSAWLPSLMHYLFLDEPRTRRIVGEPAASHAQQIKNLDRSGFAKVKHVHFSHKTALLVVLLRERYFGDRLWRPGEAARAADRPMPAAA